MSDLIKKAKAIPADKNYHLTRSQRMVLSEEIVDLLAEAWDEGYEAKPGSTPALSALLGIKNPYRN